MADVIHWMKQPKTAQRERLGKRTLYVSGRFPAAQFEAVINPLYGAPQSVTQARQLIDGLNLELYRTRIGTAPSWAVAPSVRTRVKAPVVWGAIRQETCRSTRSPYLPPVSVPTLSYLTTGWRQTSSVN